MLLEKDGRLCLSGDQQMLLAFWKDLVSEKQPGPEGDFSETVSHGFALECRRSLEGLIDVICAYYADDVLKFFPANQS